MYKKLVDTHVHFVHSTDKEYTIDLLYEIIETAKRRNISEIHLLEHTHQFKEFFDVYLPVMNYNEYQKNWLERRMGGSINRYIDFINKIPPDLPVKIKFGLEVCYIPKTSDLLLELLYKYKKHFDFYKGAVHWIDGFGFDFARQKKIWLKVNVDKMYKRYYEIMAEMITTNVFDGIAHPDSIKCFGFYPSYDLSGTYIQLAGLLKKHNVYVENNGGLFNNYEGKQELGMNEQMLKIFISKGVKILTASDAHKPADTGKHIKELAMQLEK